ncbi:hypothetical protein AC629_19815 [Bradyrhizobium sp. NAS80.1]|uniref:ABC-three component system protein n=1 Tax=Bradyrhizobium sp. NAS80.1 TaxID=1680159 RepID=UPI000964FD2B|nr:ABC-three component system protein [Bradyrhizobium sp. NAS80.1]OKO85257.1 hypothetical protein AC629_19815 [Bradyrhizobium sp. NAS80.1]
MADEGNGGQLVPYHATGSVVDQSGSSAGGDIVARDKIEHHHYPNPIPSGVVEKLIRKLQAEIQLNVHAQHTVDALACFQVRRSIDGVEGLEAKLKVADREDQLWSALDKKEQFAKLLQQWSLYASAQEIFAYLLAKAEFEFNHFVHPKIPSLPPSDIDQLVHDRIVQTIIDEIGVDVFVLNHGTAMGMLYWLAEQCFIRWHK